MIYAIQQEGAGPVKIGYSATEKGCLGRLGTLQTGNPLDLAVVGLAEGTQEDEQRVHFRCAPWRIRGEWFIAEGEVAAWIAENPFLGWSPEVKRKIVRRSVTMRIDEDLWLAVCQAANAAGMTKTAWVEQACEAALSGTIQAPPAEPSNVETPSPRASGRDNPTVQELERKGLVTTAARVEPRRPDNLALARMRKLGL